MAIEWGFYDPPLTMSASQDEKMRAPLMSAVSQEITSATLYHEIIRARWITSASAGSQIKVVWTHQGTGEKVFEWIDVWTDSSWKWYQAWIGHLPNMEIYNCLLYTSPSPRD